MTLQETYEVGTNLNALSTDIARLVGERESRCREAIGAVALFYPQRSPEEVAASLCACLRAIDEASRDLLRRFWQEVERLHFIQPLLAANKVGCMFHLVIDLTASAPDEVAALLETITEEVTQGSREGEGYTITGDIEPEENAAFWDDEDEDDELPSLDFDDDLLRDDEDDPQPSSEETAREGGTA